MNKTHAIDLTFKKIYVMWGGVGCSREGVMTVKGLLGRTVFLSVVYTQVDTQVK